MAIYKLDENSPHVHASAYVAEHAVVIGNVELQEFVGVWPQAVVRGDNEKISVGPGTNIQEGAVLHTDPGYELTVGADVTVGHQAMLHGCTIGDGSLIGIQAVVLNGAVIGRNCLVAAGALVTEGKSFPDNSLIVGVPAKVVRSLDEQAIQGLRKNAAEYVSRIGQYKKGLVRLS